MLCHNVFSNLMLLIVAMQEDKRKSKGSDNDKRDYNSPDGMPRIREEAVEDAKTEANKRGVCDGYRFRYTDTR